MPRLKNMVLWKSILLTALCSLAILGLWWWGLVYSLETQGRARAKDSIGQMERTIARELERAEETGIAFGSWWTKEHGRLDDPVSLQNVIGFLEKGAIITNLVLARANGDSACVGRIDGEWNLVLFKSGRIPRRYLVKNGTWVPGTASPTEVYEVRERYWYKFGAIQHVPTWTPKAYRYYTSPVAGFTFTVPVRGSQGKLEGVIGVDVSAEDLTQLIWENQPTQGSRMIVTDPAGRLLVPPRIPEMSESGTRYAHHLTPLSPAHLENWLGGILTGPHGERSKLFAPGQAYARASSSFSKGNEPQMNLLVAIPKDELFPGQRRRAVLTLALALAAILGVAWTLLDLHNRVVRPMGRLAERAVVADGETTEPMDFNSDIWEFQQVGERLHLAGRADHERKRLLSQVEHSQRVDSVGVMAPGIVHDVNNQLALVLGQITLCKSVLEAHPELQPRLRAAEGATIKCAEVLRALLDYSRPDPGQRELLSLNAIVEGAASLLQRVLGNSIAVETDLSRDLPLLFGESVKLQQVLVNLGLNARDAMPEGGFLRFRTFAAQGNACLEVQDSGCGMGADVKARAFEPFFSTKEPGKGTGLGLAMVANIVAAHGGNIQIESEPGSGTLFRMEFPPAPRKGMRVLGENEILETV